MLMTLMLARSTAEYIVFNQDDASRSFIAAVASIPPLESCRCAAAGESFVLAMLQCCWMPADDRCRCYRVCGCRVHGCCPFRSSRCTTAILGTASSPAAWYRWSFTGTPSEPFSPPSLGRAACAQTVSAAVPGCWRLLEFLAKLAQEFSAQCSARGCGKKNRSIGCSRTSSEVSGTRTSRYSPRPPAAPPCTAPPLHPPTDLRAVV